MLLLQRDWVCSQRSQQEAHNASRALNTISWPYEDCMYIMHIHTCRQPVMHINKSLTIIKQLLVRFFYLVKAPLLTNSIVLWKMMQIASFAVFADWCLFNFAHRLVVKFSVSVINKTHDQSNIIEGI